MKLLTKKQTRHGFHGTPVYRIWSEIVKRCEVKSSDNYKYYGERGISVCKEWRLNPKAFCEWALSNGFQPGLQIDRIDNNKGYNPSNCQFVTHKQNCAPGKRRLFSNNKTGERCISVRKNGRFEVYVQINGRQKYVGVRATLSEAIELRDSMEQSGNIHDTHLTKQS